MIKDFISLIMIFTAVFFTYSCNRIVYIPSENILEFKQEYISLLSYLDKEYSYSSEDNDSCSYYGFDFKTTSTIILEDYGLMYFKDRFYVEGEFYESYTAEFDELSMEYFSEYVTGEIVEIVLSFDTYHSEFKFTKENVDLDEILEWNDTLSLDGRRQIKTLHKGTYFYLEETVRSYGNDCHTNNYLVLVPYPGDNEQQVKFILLKETEPYTLSMLSILFAKYNKKKDILSFDKYIDLNESLGIYPLLWRWKGE